MHFFTQINDEQQIRDHKKRTTGKKKKGKGKGTLQ